MDNEFEWSSDHQKFESYAAHVRFDAEELLIDQFGERCSDYDENCECCRRWKLLDQLLENPHPPPRPAHH